MPSPLHLRLFLTTVLLASSLAAAVPGNTTTLSVTANDPDSDPLVYTWSKATGPGTVTFGAGNGTTSGNSCTAVASQVGLYTFTVTVDDGHGHLVASTTGNVVWTDKPVANPQGVITTMSTAVAISLGGSDAHGGIASYAVASNPTHGSLSGSGASRTYAPAAGYTGADSFTFTVTDAYGMVSDPATVGLTVNPAANTPPTIAAIADQSTAVSTPTTPIAFTVGDLETAAASLAVTGASSNLTLVPVANIVFAGSGASRTLTVTPAAGQSGVATITVAVSDGTANAAEPFVLTVGGGGGGGSGSVDVGSVSGEGGGCGAGALAGLLAAILGLGLRRRPCVIALPCSAPRQGWPAS